MSKYQVPMDNIIRMIQSQSDPIDSPGPCKVSIRIRQQGQKIAVDIEGAGQDMVQTAIGCLHAALLKTPDHGSSDLVQKKP